MSKNDLPHYQLYKQDRCAWCDKALELLKEHGVPYRVIHVGQDITTAEFAEQFPGQKTLPLVVYEPVSTHFSNQGKLIGGYEDLVRYFGDGDV